MTEPRWLQQKRKEAENLMELLPEEKVRYVSGPSGRPAGKNSGGQYAATIVQSGQHVTVHLTGKMKEAGVVVKDINHALQEHDLEKYFEDPGSRQAASNMAYFNTGVLLIIPDGAALEEPVYHIISAGGSVVSRNIIIAGRNSKARIIQELSGDAENYSEITAIHLKEGAKLEFAAMQNQQKSRAYIRRRAVCESRSFLDLRNAFFGSENTYARNEVDLEGEGAEASTLDIYFGTGRQRFDSMSSVNHKAMHTRSRSDVRGALKDGAKLAPHGNVRIEKHARASDAFLTEHILLLDAGAEADPVPALEIATNDVKAGHSASVSQIDEEQLFYLMARGLSGPEAMKMIVLGFLEPALAMAETLRAHVMSNLEAKWG